MLEWVGYRWLGERFDVAPVQPLRTISQIGTARATVYRDGCVSQTYLPAWRPPATVAGHLTFALKHETLHLEFLARLFAVLPPGELERWIAEEPTGQYARRACFFYEWLSGRQLQHPGVSAGNYVDALDADVWVTAVRSRNNPRWRVRDNLPGTRDFCPLVLRTERVRAAETYDCVAQLAALEQDFGQDLLLRSAVWLTVKESRASFAIEHEEQHVDRVQRFAAVMERRCGTGPDPLSATALADLQLEILGPRATRYGVRRSPVFIGEVRGFAEVVHYIAPHWDAVPAMMDGLATFAECTLGRASLVRAAVLSFGFVYIHPMVDGNGRISRFLVNDTLRRDQVVPEPYVLPISATIAGTARDRRSYDTVLEVFSRPLLERYRVAWRFGERQLAEDGVAHNFEFSAWDDAAYAWRYLDLTDHVEYLADVIAVTLEQEMREEAGYLRAVRAARAGIKEWLEGPDTDIDRIIRSVRENGNQVSVKLRKEFPALNDAAVAGGIAAVIERAFAGTEARRDDE